MPDQPLSEAAERVLGDARAEAERLGHEFIGSEHLLLGLLRSSDLAQSSLDAAGIDRSALASVLESGQKRVRVRSDAPQAEGVPLSSHARRLLEAGAAGEGALEANVLLAALTDRRGALTRFLGEKGIPPEVVIAEVASRAGVSAPVVPPPRERPEKQDRPEGQQRQEKAPRQEQQEKQERPARQEKTARERQERPTRQERQHPETRGDEHEDR